MSHGDVRLLFFRLLSLLVGLVCVFLPLLPLRRLCRGIFSVIVRDIFRLGLGLGLGSLARLVPRRCHQIKFLLPRLHLEPSLLVHLLRVLLPPCCCRRRDDSNARCSCDSSGFKERRRLW